MKIRIQFQKSGAMRFIGHLDVMRFFQKLLRRANIPIAYSAGLSPHQIMSFALPLGIGLTSDAEYLDIEITDSISSKKAIEKMNENSVDGIVINSFKELKENAENAMSSVKAAGYSISFRDDIIPSDNLVTAFSAFMKQKEIKILKKTKKSETIVDIKPFIHRFSTSKSQITLLLSCGSVNNTKPELVMQAFYEYLEKEFDEYMLLIKRLDLYTGTFPNLVSLNDIGEDIYEQI